MKGTNEECLGTSGREETARAGFGEEFGGEQVSGRGEERGDAEGCAVGKAGAPGQNQL